MLGVKNALKHALFAQGVEAWRGAPGCLLPAPAARRSARAERWHAAQPERHDSTGCVLVCTRFHDCSHLDKNPTPTQVPAAACPCP